MAGALSGIRVLDLSRVLAGPWAAQTLGDMGAEVIKVERPVTGDDTRSWGPPYVRDANGEPTRESAYFMCANRNKKSVTIDFTRPEGQDLVRQLAAKSDIVVENFKVGGLKQYGLDYASLSAIDPRLIYCSITGFGQTGPYASRPGYDFLIQAMGGLMSVTGHNDGEPGGGPMKVGVALTDVTTGLYATIAILGALAARGNTGRGQHIDMSLLDVQIACLANQAMNYLHGGVIPGRLGNAHPNVVPYQDFPTADGSIILAVGNESQFGKLCAVLERPELAADSRFVSNAARVANRNELIPILRSIIFQRTTDTWLAKLELAGVPSGPVNTLDRVFLDPQVIDRSLKIEMEHTQAGHLPLVASPVRLSDTPVEYRLAPPLLGEHTADVLSTVLNLDREVLAGLASENVI
ncbi:UNVERIFIED_ORG: crotonobetainyl-CoA:carnitine CoA-transferase CaiB-like acyl-CoA transferase [Paraburkholderia sediminicola]|nr:crotonobetainyl-CoA:carnitine CoA-transferase CaiB-like acyl-CoA transferase [Paraburkholderia sediminicola]